MSEQNKDGKPVRDLKPGKDPKGGFGPEPPDGNPKNQDSKGNYKQGAGGPSISPPTGGTN